MSEKEKRVRIDLPKRERKLLGELCEETGLTLDQGLALAMLYFFEKHDQELFEKAKRGVDPAVVHVFEKEHLHA